MSEFFVNYTTIRNIYPHPNTEVHSLQVAEVYGFNIVVRKDQYKVGDRIFLIPIDSVLNQDIENIILGPTPKIKFNNHRVKQIRIQKYPSQGLILNEETVVDYLKLKGLKSNIRFELEKDYKDLLNISKFEPPVPEYIKNRSSGTQRTKPLENSNFHKYNGLDNIRYFPDMFKEGEQVVIQEKLHGSNCRAGIVPTQANTLWKKIRKFFGVLPKFEKVYGSNMVELTNRAGYTGFYGEDVYGKVLNKVKAFEKLQPGEQIFGELIGQGIQKNYDYGHKEHHFVLFDVKYMVDGQWVWMEPWEVEKYAKERGFDIVPTLYEGPYNKQLAHELTMGDSVYCPKQKIREGIVIKAVEYNNPACSNKKKSLKWVSEKYLDKDNTDFH